MRINQAQPKVNKFIQLPEITVKHLQDMAAYVPQSETATVIEAIEEKWQRFILQVDHEMAVEADPT